MHYIGSYNIDRDAYFNRNGWVVIRFAEEQIVKHPELCCQYVVQVVNSLINDYQYPEGSEKLQVTQQWTYKEAVSMAENNYREQYLNLEFTQKEEPTIIE